VQHYDKLSTLNNTNYISKIFSKDSEQLKLKDIENFFLSPQEETSVLEFKAGEVEIIDLYKEIAAFLNTEGGLIIVGSPRERKERINKNEITFCEGPLTYSKFKNKDWISQKIASNITPSPTNLKITEFLTENGAIFLIDVPQSSIPPHQNSADGRYYIRMEREAKPAPHGLVQALFNKRRLPKLDANISIKKENHLSDNISIEINNLSNIPADMVSWTIEVYNVHEIVSEDDFKLKNNPDSTVFMFHTSAPNQILVQRISFSNEFQVIHKESEYLIFVGFWSKDLDMDYRYWTLNPEEKKISCEGKMEIEGTKFIDELYRVNNVAQQNL